MNRRLYVGNLPYSVTEEELTEFFSKAGEVEEGSVSIPHNDRGQSKGFGFVTMADDKGLEEAMKLDKTEMQGRMLTVNEARPREDRQNAAPATETVVPMEEASEAEEATEAPAEEEAVEAEETEEVAADE